MKKMIAMALFMGLMMSFPGKAQEASSEKVALDVRTNLMTWAFGAPGIGIDVRFANRWQVGIDGAYGNWDLDGEREGFRITTSGLQARRYFRPFGTQHVGRDLNGDGKHEYTSYSRGAFVGLDARYYHYNQTFFSQVGGSEGDVITAGIIGGYSFALSKDGRWGVDALLGLGFVHNDYVDYEWYAPAQLNRITYPNVKNNFGLTTAEVSVTYKFLLVSAKNSLGN